jgi:hypothetical protein
VTLSVVDASKISERQRHVEMIGTKLLLCERDSALSDRESFGILSGIVEFFCFGV